MPSSTPAHPRVPTEQLSTLLTLIRHAHSASNDEGEETPLSGWTDVPITPLGRQQVEHLRKRLTGGLGFEVIYSSPLRRAKDTAATLSTAGLGPLRIHPALREIGCGELDGMMLRDIQARFPALWQANLRQDDEDFRWPGGESYREFRSRCLLAIEALAGAHPGSRIALVTHAGFISQAVGSILGTSAARWEQHRTGNTAVTTILWVNGAGVLVGLDDRTHLPSTPCPAFTSALT